LQGCGIDVDRLRKQLVQFFTDHLDVNPRPEHEIVQTVSVQRAMQRAILHIQSSGKSQVQAGDFLAAMLEEEDAFAVYYLKAQGLTRLAVLEYISHQLPDAGGAAETETKEGGKQSALDKYTVDLVARAEAGKIDPLVGRDEELKRTLQVLARRKKNNPIFVGDPGVGKTAVAEGLALKIARGEVPEQFAQTRILPWTWAVSWPGPSTVATSRRGSRELFPSSRPWTGPSCASTRSTPSSAPVPPAADPWTRPIS
jgi:ATPases with chaperone activity, ATP-binding subunit